MDCIRSRIVKAIEAQWPRTLQQWLVFQAGVKVRKEYWVAQHSDAHGCLRATTNPKSALPEPVSAINLATEFDIPAILPAAFYRLAITDLQLDASGTFPWLKPSDFIASWSSLGQQNWSRLANGKEELIRQHQEVADAYEEPYYNSQWCPRNSDECQELAKKLKLKYDDAFNVRFVCKPDILGLIVDVLNSEEAASGEWDFCHSCKPLFKASLRDFMEKIWNALPVIFGLI